MEKIRTEIYETEHRKTIEKINEPKSQVFEKIYTTVKPLARVTKKKRSHQLPMQRNEGDPQYLSREHSKHNRGIL